MYYVQASQPMPGADTDARGWTMKKFHSLEYAKKAAVAVGGRVWRAEDVAEIQKINGYVWFGIRAGAKPVFMA